jgi:asparagine synthase (glutamine-hydrolysing)
MIGGYFYIQKDNEMDQRLRALTSGYDRLEAFDNGYFFQTNPFRSETKGHASSENAVAISEDLLVVHNASSSYRFADLDAGFLPEFERQGAAAFDSIQSDFRMAVAHRQANGRYLYLASNRAGSGRIYYHRLEKGIVFCSDLRFLLKIAPFEISRKAVYSLLKYGCIPEPLTVAEHISAIPAAHYLKYCAESGEESLAPYFKYEFTADSPSAQFDESILERVKEALRGTASFFGGFPSAMLLSGGIDSSLYGCYLNQEKPGSFQGFYCSFGQYDPEYRYALSISERLGAKLQVAIMGKADAMRALDDVVRLTDHPFSDFSSLPIVFLLQYIRERQPENSLVIECNGGDDCFGFGDLMSEQKFRVKHSFPGIVKTMIAKSLARSSCWKWESSEGLLARIAALADVHEKSYLNYFLVQAPANYLSMGAHPDWDDSLQDAIEKTAVNCGSGYANLGYEAKTTIRQLLYVNSSRWAAKALSVGESLGKRVVYPYIWRDILMEQGKLPWSAKTRDGIIKWPLKRLLEEYMPADFIYRKKSGFVPPFVQWLTIPEFNEKVREMLTNSQSLAAEIIPARILDGLLDDARHGKRLRYPILNMLWGAYFSESWIKTYRLNQ